MSKLSPLLVLLWASCAWAAAPTPDASRDTLSPVYDWKSLPYTWRQIRAGEFPLTPVHWQRHAGNPVVSKGMNPRPVSDDGSTIRVYYGNRGPGEGIYYFDVSSSTPERIEAGPVGPIITTGAAASYDEQWVIAPEPVRLSDSRLRMYYSAKRSGGFFDKTWTLAVAESDDNGRTWQKYAGNPILSPTNDAWECGAVGFCSVEKGSKDWRMWYLGTNNQNDAVKQVGYASSKDGLNWTRHEGNPVISVNNQLAWEAGAIAVPRVIRDGKLYKVWYCCYEHNDTYAIGQAESFDGLRWFRSPHNPVLQGEGGTAFDGQMTAYPGAIRVGERYLMWYSGNGYGAQGIGLAAARAPQGALHYRVGPVETPDASWSQWQELRMTDTEPPRQGFIQLAIVGSRSARDHAVTEPAAIACDLRRGAHRGVQLDDQYRLRLQRGDEGHVSQGEYTSEPVDLRGAGVVKLQWTEQWTAPQRWEKHPENPIYGPGKSGAWDQWTNGVAVVRNPDAKTYKMFYAGRNGAGIGFAEATIDNPLVWKEHPTSPVLKPRTDNWEGNSLNQPRVVKLTDQHWRMYYTGWGFKGAENSSSWAFGLAESFDAGLTWTRYDDGPLMNRGSPGEADDGGVFVPEVRRIGDKWMMWYTAMKVNPPKQSIHICLATSDDGVHWTKYAHNPVLTDDFDSGPVRNVTSRCYVRHQDGVFQMWYSHARPAYRIRYAESLDGIRWERSPIELALDVGPAGAWDDQMVEYPEVDLVDGQWRMWFCGNGYGKVGFAQGVVETTVKLLFRSGPTPVPDASWSGWQPVVRRADLKTSRYAQIKADLRSLNPQLSPALSRVTFLVAAD
jgi:predicted GH43/DUF377 family glycosyl hydrolase